MFAIKKWAEDRESLQLLNRFINHHLLFCNTRSHIFEFSNMALMGNEDEQKLIVRMITLEL